MPCMAGACPCAIPCGLLSPPFCPTARARRWGWKRATASSAPGLYSWVGRRFRLRRADLRIFVTAGAGAAIAAAFNAPLAGAFYGYELILGSYTTRALAPVVVAASPPP